MRNQWLWRASWRTRPKGPKHEAQHLASSKAEVLCLCWLASPSMLLPSFRAELVRSPR